MAEHIRNEDGSGRMPDSIGATNLSSNETDVTSPLDLTVGDSITTNPSQSSIAALPSVEVSLVRPGADLVIPGATDAPQETIESPELDYFSPGLWTNSKDTSSEERSQPEKPVLHHTTAFVKAARHSLYGTDTGKQTFAVPEPSTDVEDTPTPAHSGDGRRPRAIPQRSLTEHPKFPNQSYAALQHQAHPVSYRQWRNSRPPALSRPLLAASGAATKDDVIGRRQSKSTSNTPAPSPGLFALPKPIPAFDYERHGERSPYPSPYLHPAQLVPPKTVKTAERNVDTYSGHKMINHYEVLEELGRGVHGKVKLARDLDTGEYVAIKIVRRYPKRRRLGKPNNPEETVKREIAILKKIQHPNVVRMIEVIDDPEDKQVYIALEFCELKEISWRVKGTSEIIILEHRRVEREKQAIPDSTAFAQNERVLQAAARRRAREERANRQANRRSKSEADFWSLEYAGDTDDDTEDLSELSDKFSTANDEEPQLEESYSLDEGLLARSRTGSSARISLRSALAGRSTERIFGDYTLWGELEWPHPGSQPDVVHSSERDLYAFGQHELARQQSVTDSVSSRLSELVEEQILEDERYVPTMTIPECRMAFRDALVGLEFLHYNGIVHRDIKPENLLRTKEHAVKISDFGVSYLGKPPRKGGDSPDASESEAADIQDEAELAKTVGTPGFYAPELCYIDLEGGDPPSVTGQIDVWALGVTLFCMLFAKLPYSANDVFTLIKCIREDAVFIPRLRLKAVDARPSSRAQSQGPLFRQSKEKRLPSEWVHEAIDDDLYDLMTRLLDKDPKKRITIKDIKHHPWVLAGLPDPEAWLSETEPARLAKGKKINITQEEVRDAFKPIDVIRRVRSIANRVGRGLGLSGGKSRKRGQSSASSSDAGLATTPPTGGDIPLHSGKRSGSRHEDQGSVPPKHTREREGEHPLSHSLDASPDITPPTEAPRRSPMASALPPSFKRAPLELTTPLVRPSMPDRNASEMSTATSVRTVRQADIDRGKGRSPSPTEMIEGHISPLLEDPPEPSESTSSGLGSIFSGAGRSLLRSVRSRERNATGPMSLAASADGPRYEETSDLHGQASVAVSNTSAAGHVEKSSKFIAFARDPFGSRNPSRAAPETAAKKPPMRSNTDDGAYLSTIDSSNAPLDAQRGGPGERSDQPSSAERWDLAQEALARRRVLEDRMNAEDLAASRPNTSSGEIACPLSPDDMEKDSEPVASNQNQETGAGYFPASATASANPDASVQPISSASSEDYFASNMSQSTSIPSIPSAVSADSSVSSSSELQDHKEDSANSSEGTARSEDSSRVPFRATRIEPDPDDGYIGDGDSNGYDNDSAITGDDSSSDSDEDFLVMNKRQSSVHRSERPDSSSTPRLTRYRVRRQTAEKKSRSGSTNTMKQISPIHTVPGEGALAKEPQGQ